MGRVAKYKKVKSSVDRMGTPWGGFAEKSSTVRKVKKRSLTATGLKNKKIKRRKDNDNAEAFKTEEGFDLAPSGKDEFSMSDLMGTIRKETPLILDQGLEARADEVSSSKRTSVVPDNTIGKEANKMARELNINPKHPEQKKKKTAATARKEGESMKAFGRRVKDETRQIIKQNIVDNRPNSDKRQKKKEFLNNKKKKKNKGRTTNSQDYSDDEDGSYHRSSHGADDSFVTMTGKQAAALAASKIPFGDQVERPPVFAQLPRGAKTKDLPKIKSSNKSGTMNDSQIAAERNAMEKMRLKVQAQYAVIKANRRKAGNAFHL